MNTKEAFEKSLVDHIPYIRRIVGKVAKNCDVVDDISQEVCLRIIDKEKLWRKKSTHLTRWMNAIARNLTIDHVRKKKIKTSEGEMHQLFSSEEESFSEKQIEWVVNQFQTLSEKQRQVLNMRYYQGLTVTQIGIKLGITQPTASHHINAALKILRKRAKSKGLLAILLPLDLRLKDISKGVIMSQFKTVSIVTISLVLGVALSHLVKESDQEDSSKDQIKFIATKNNVDLDKKYKQKIQELSQSYEEKIKLLQNRVVLAESGLSEKEAKIRELNDKKRIKNTDLKKIVLSGIDSLGQVYDLTDDTIVAIANDEDVVQLSDVDRVGQFLNLTDEDKIELDKFMKGIQNKLNESEKLYREYTTDKEADPVEYDTKPFYDVEGRSIETELRNELVRIAKVDDYEAAVNKSMASLSSRYDDFGKNEYKVTTYKNGTSMRIGKNKSSTSMLMVIPK